MADEPKTTGTPAPASDKGKVAAEPGAKGAQGQKPAKTYTQAEVDVIASQAGRKKALELTEQLQTVSKDRDTWKSKYETEIAETKQEIESLNSQLEEATKDDPDRQAILKAKREAEVKLKTLIPREAAADLFERNKLVGEIAASYVTAAGEDVDADSLTKSADKWGILKPDRARLEDLAAEKGWKLREEVTEPAEFTIQEPSAPLSGKTRGGSEERYTANQIESMSPQEITALQKKHQGKSLLALIAEGVIVEK